MLVTSVKKEIVSFLKKILIAMAIVLLIDCAGVCGGDAIVDDCGVCAGTGPDVMCDDGSMVCDASDCETNGG